MLSPVQAPIQAARPSRMIEGDPEVDHSEARVTMVDSLGTDGKNPSNAAKRYTTRCTHHASATDRTHPSASSVRDSSQSTVPPTGTPPPVCGTSRIRPRRRRSADEYRYYACHPTEPAPPHRWGRLAGSVGAGVGAVRLRRGLRIGQRHLLGTGLGHRLQVHRVADLLDDAVAAAAGEGQLSEQALALGAHDDRVTDMDLAEQDLLRQGVLDVALDGAAQRAGTEHGVVPLLGQQLLGLVAQLDLHVLLGQSGL